MSVNFDGPFPFPADAQDDAVLFAPIFHPPTLTKLLGRAPVPASIPSGLPVLARARCNAQHDYQIARGSLEWHDGGRENARRDPRNVVK